MVSKYRVSQYILCVHITTKGVPNFLSCLIQSKLLTEIYSSICTNHEIIDCEAQSSNEHYQSTGKFPLLVIPSLRIRIYQVLG